MHRNLCYIQEGYETLEKQETIVGPVDKIGHLEEMELILKGIEDSEKLEPGLYSGGKRHDSRGGGERNCRKCVHWIKMGNTNA